MNSPNQSVSVTEGLANITQENGDGAFIVPETRLADAADAQALVQRAVVADGPRDTLRAKVQGLVDGNAPYRSSDLVAAGRADACNVNWGIARAYVGTGKDAFYDIFNEAETYATVTLDIDDPTSVDKGRVVTEEFDRLQKRDRSFDSTIQMSQREMILFGTGPMIFPDATDWRPLSVLHRHLLVPENQKSDLARWEWCAVRRDYLPHELYEYILNEGAAAKIGWRPEAVKRAIMLAHPAYQTGGVYLNWEWYQQQLKNHSYYYSAQSQRIFTAHVFFKEFPKEGEVTGRITHVIVQEANNGASDSANNEFLFQHIGRFKSWEQCVHPLYYDHGSGGEHHAVEGMGTRMYSSLEFDNRLRCNLADKAFAPRMLFKPSSSAGEEVAAVANLSEWGLIPSTWDAVQTPVQGMLQDGLAMLRENKSMLASNLSQYRQDLEQDEGNPITATETQWRASEQSKLGNTQLNRYYNQLDALYAEKFRRAANPNLTESMPGGAEAIEFQRRCERRGVKLSDLQRVDSVTATRVIGQGSQFTRQQQLASILGMVAMLPEDGRDNVIRDTIASRAGQSFVKRYYPTPPAMQKPSEQTERAVNQVAVMKAGMMPVVDSSQNAVIFAQTYLEAGTAALQSLQQGANPASVLPFMESCGQAIAQQLARIQDDPSRKDVYKALEAQFRKYGELVDKVKASVQQQLEQQQAQAAKVQQQRAKAAQEQTQAQNGNGNGGPSPVDLAQAQQTQTRTKLDALKTAQEMRHAEESHQQTAAIRNVETVAKVRGINAKTVKTLKTDNGNPNGETQ